ncbi:MAG: class III lanthionine synthetase LanKC [Pyrinomonadaceae bacterium]|nr:class III lanthionine synthetase LanKC [Pyrinomonadaceae bacterium]
MLNLIANDDFFESFDYYRPNESDYLSVVKKLLPDDWSFHRNGTWFGVSIPAEVDKPLPLQGWKIHISSSVKNAVEILEAVVPIFRKDNIHFKFSLDETVLTLMNSKRYGRQGAGKFITVYPFDDEHFKTLIEDLHQATRSFEGAYILSDRRYKDSKVVFYRYGGLRALTKLNASGKKDHTILSPDGKQVIDERVPYFRVPEWTKDPFEDTTKETAVAKEAVPSQITLKEGRYIVKGTLGHSNAGGVYIAEDTETSQDVIIKEARPFVVAGENSVMLLEKEFRLLSLLDDAEFVPKAVDFFMDWEHSFLVMEKIPGLTLANFSVSKKLAIKVKATLEDVKSGYEDFQKIFLQLARHLKALHERGIVFTDFSPNNVVINPDTLDVKMIDLEGAFEVGVDKPVRLFTPGFVAPNQNMGEQANFDSDWFSFGAIMHHYLASINQVLSINPKIRYTYLKAVIDDIGFPEEIYTLIIGLMEKDPKDHPSYETIIETLEKDRVLRDPEFRFDKEAVDQAIATDIDPICNYIMANADFSRTDRLFPADAEIFNTNPLSLFHGAVGVAYCLKKMTGKVPDNVIDWILARNKNPELYPTGLYVGLSGIAWGMLELGLVPESKSILQSTFDHPLLYTSADLGDGAAGWGMTNLKFFHELQDELFLQKALEAGEFITANLSENENGCFWDADKTGKNIHLGYYFGSSGISLFLLYLYLASKKEKFLDYGIKALDFDLNNATVNNEGFKSWKKVVDQGRIVYPYFGEGSAGVGKAVVRYSRLLGEEKYRKTIDEIFLDTNRKYAIYPGLNRGLAGLGDFLVDLYNLTKKQEHLDGAYRIASGILLSKIKREAGIAYPGEGLLKISCDYATGSAGIGRFLRRLTCVSEDADFTVDGLFQQNSSANV